MNSFKKFNKIDKILKKGNSDNIYKVIIKEFGIFDYEENGNSLYHLAILYFKSNPDFHIMSFLYQLKKHNPNFNCKNKDGKTFLQLAIEQKISFWIIQEIIYVYRDNIDFNSIDNDNRTLAHYLIDLNGQLPLEILVNNINNCNIHIKDNEGNTILDLLEKRYNQYKNNTEAKEVEKGFIEVIIGNIYLSNFDFFINSLNENNPTTFKFLYKIMPTTFSELLKKIQAISNKEDALRLTKILIEIGKKRNIVNELLCSCIIVAIHEANKTKEYDYCFDLVSLFLENNIDLQNHFSLISMALMHSNNLEILIKFYAMLSKQGYDNLKSDIYRNGSFIENFNIEPKQDSKYLVISEPFDKTGPKGLYEYVRIYGLINMLDELFKQKNIQVKGYVEAELIIKLFDVLKSFKNYANDFAIAQILVNKIYENSINSINKDELTAIDILVALKELNCEAIELLCQKKLFLK